MLWHTLSTQVVFNSALALISSSHGTFVSASDEKLACSQVFPGQAHNSAHACGLHVPQGYVRDFKIP